MPRALLISYAFPPTGGAGVQRPAKFAKYLPRFGWDVSILTVSNPSVPLSDSSLTADVPRDTVIERAQTYEPSYAAKSLVLQDGASAERFNITGGVKQAIRAGARMLLQPDPQVLWVPQALRRGNHLLKRLEHHAIVATAPPFSSFITGAFLSRRFDLPLILDYRDEWDVCSAHWENRGAGSLSRRWQRRQQTRLMRRASAIIATTQSSARSLQTLAEEARSRAKVTCIYNGYDPDDFRDQSRNNGEKDAIVRMVYSGTLWNLTDISPLVGALELLDRQRRDVVQRIELGVYGRRTADQNSVLTRLCATSCKLVIRDYVPHREIIPIITDADCLCLQLAAAGDAARVVPAKLFEYMATGRPILAIAPKGEVWSLLHSYPAAFLHAPEDLNGIAKTIETIVARNDRNIPPGNFDAAQYSRETLTGELAHLLDDQLPLSPASSSRPRTQVHNPTVCYSAPY